MTNAETIIQAAYRAADMHSTPEDVYPVVVAVLRELAKSYEDPYKVCQEDLVGDELTELADEIEERTIDRR